MTQWNRQLEYHSFSTMRVKYRNCREGRPRYAVLVYLSEHFEKDRIYEEWEVNAVCGEWHTFGDYFLLRRELVESGLLCRKRDGSAYWKATTDTKPEPHP